MLARLTGEDAYIKAKLEKGYSFRLLIRELSVSHQALVNSCKRTEWAQCENTRRD
jgi:lambda repressor-like predicted transcriptional regulator